MSNITLSPQLGAPGPSSDLAWSFQLVPLAFLICMAVLAVSMAAGTFLQKNNVLFMSDAGVALLLGILAGGFMWLVGVSTEVNNMITFKYPLFISVLLPMIMWFAGYTLSIRSFLLNYESISLLAFLGTAISSVVVSIIMWGAGALGWCYQMDFSLNFAFGASKFTSPISLFNS